MVVTRGRPCEVCWEPVVVPVYIRVAKPGRPRDVTVVFMDGRRASKLQGEEAVQAVYTRPHASSSFNSHLALRFTTSGFRPVLFDMQADALRQAHGLAQRDPAATSGVSEATDRIYKPKTYLSILHTTSK